MSISLRSRPVRFAIAAATLGLVAGSAAAVSATVGGGGGARDGGESGESSIRESLSGYEEAPLALSTSGHGVFRAMIDDQSQEITYLLSYDALEGSVQQAHIHFGTPGQSGSNISVFLCTNLGNGPVGTQLCPPAPGEVTGTIRPADVIGPAALGISAGEFVELVAAVRAGSAYINVHSAKYPGGEIRGQIENGHDGHH